MEFSLLTIFSGAIGGSIITLTANQILTNRKEKDRIKNEVFEFVEILKDLYIVNLQSMLEDCKELKQSLNIHDSITCNFTDISFLKPNLFNIVDKTLIAKACFKKKVEVKYIAHLYVLTNLILDRSPEKLLNNFACQLKKNKDERTDRFYKLSNPKVKDYDEQIEIINNILIHNSNGLLQSTLHNIDALEEEINTLLTIINDEFIAKLSK